MIESEEQQIQEEEKRRWIHREKIFKTTKIFLFSFIFNLHLNEFNSDFDEIH